MCIRDSIGAIHRRAAFMDNYIELVCGCFSVNPEISRSSGREYFLPDHRVYDTYKEMFEKEMEPVSYTHLANLTTSCLYYDALLSATYLGKDLGKPASQIQSYKKQAKELRQAIEDYFGGTVEGFNTYKYYKENNVLRSWICIPLTVGIYDRKEETIKALFSPHLWTENGLLTQAGSETFWDRSTLYALRGVLASGETEKGMKLSLIHILSL